MKRMSRTSLLVAAAGAAIQAGAAVTQDTYWADAVSGSWSDSVRWTAGVPNTTAYRAIIDRPGTYVITVDTSPSVGEIYKLNPGSRLDLASGSTMYLSGVFINNGLTVVNSNLGGSGTQIRFNADAEIQADNGLSGELHLNAHPSNLDTAILVTDGGATLTNTQYHTISGAGRVNATLINRGHIVADNPAAPMELTAGAKTNLGRIAVEPGATLRLSATSLSQAGSGYVVADHGTFILSNASVHGGALNTVDSGVIRFEGWDSLSGTITGNAIAQLVSGCTLTMSGVWNNLGTLTINDSAGGGGTAVRADADSTFAAGAIVLNANPANLDTAYLQSGGAALMTIGPSTTVSGLGRIYANLSNSGQILADQPGELIDLLGAAKTNNGLARASASGSILLRGVAFSQGAAGVLEATGAGSLLDFQSATVSGGIVRALAGGHARVSAGTTTFVGGVAGSGALDVQDGSMLLINQPVWNHAGTLTINPAAGGSGTQLRAEQNCIINGTTIVLNANPANLDTAYLQTGGAALMTIAETSTVVGRGRVYAATHVDGTLSPGFGPASIGQLDTRNTVIMGPTATAEIEIRGSSATDFDRITGVFLAVDGTLRLRLADGYIPAGGEEFDVVDVSTRAGVFAIVDCDRFANGTNRFAVEYLPGKVRVRAKLCPADYDGDGFITGIDFDEFVVAFEAGNALADVDGDGFVTGIDFDEFVRALELGCEP